MRTPWWLMTMVLAGACGGDKLADMTVEAGAGPANSDAAGADAAGNDAPSNDGGIVDGNGAVTGTTMASARSGSRLKARWAQTGDGRRVFFGWLDTQLGVDCSFTLAADGEYRCLPGGAVSTKPAYEFADAACTEPVVQAGRTVPAFNEGSPACAPLSFIVQYDFAGCGAGLRVFRPGREITGSIYENGSCTKVSLAPGTTAFAVGEEVSPATFVRAQRRSVSLSPTDALQRIAFDADDGAQELFGWQRPGDPATCRMVALHDGHLHCLTSSVAASGTEFADASCTQPAAISTACSVPFKYSDVADPGVCPPVSTVHALGDRLAGYFTSLGSPCRAGPAGGGNYSALGAEIPPDTFPALDAVNEPGAHLQRRLESTGGHPAFATGWFDADRGEPCRPTVFGDKVRCAPVSNNGRTIGVYADSNCTMPLSVQPKNRCPDRYVFDVDTSSCPIRPRIFALGPRYTGPFFDGFTDRSVVPPMDYCARDQGNPTGDLYPLIPVPESDLPELTVVVE